MKKSPISLSTFLFCCMVFFVKCHAQKISIIPLTFLSQISTQNFNGKDLTAKFEYFLIRKYSDNNENRKFIDSFVNNKKDSNYAAYDRYTMIFFKETAQTNIENIRRDPKTLDRYAMQHDQVYEYQFVKGKFWVRNKIIDGVVIEPENNVILKRRD